MSRIILLVLLLPASVLADDLPLFNSDEVLQLTIEAPMRTLIRSAEKRPVVDATASYTDADGKTVELPVQISTRGKSRLTVCRFPPLSLRIKKKVASGTEFAGQKSLKIVIAKAVRNSGITCCRSMASTRHSMF
jgi:hypothetical protein